MATYTVGTVKHATLSAGVVDTVTLTKPSDGSGRVEIINRSGTDELYVTVNEGAAGAPADPTVGGDDCFVVPAALGSYEILTSSLPAVVKVVSASALKYSVIGTGL
jgi:hypothetical protein